MHRNYFSDQQLQFLLEQLLLVLLEPRTFSLYDTICSNLAAVVTIMTNRKMFCYLGCMSSRNMKSTLVKVLSPQMIQDVSCLGLLLLRLPVMNRTLEVLRSVASCIILNRLSPYVRLLKTRIKRYTKRCHPKIPRSLPP